MIFFRSLSSINWLISKLRFSQDPFSHYNASQSLLQGFPYTRSRIAIGSPRTKSANRSNSPSPRCRHDAELRQVVQESQRTGPLV